MNLFVSLDQVRFGLILLGYVGLGLMRSGSVCLPS
jgi:hypothetical protein